MREIKFRGKTAKGKWVYGSLVYSDNIEPTIYFEVGKGSVKTFDFVYVIPETVGQFTGLVDRNGVEVFEGDVVLVEKFRKGVIRCLEKEALFAVDFSSHLLRLCDTTSDYIEIIGNVHDNPELVEVTE